MWALLMSDVLYGCSWGAIVCSRWMAVSGTAQQQQQQCDVTVSVWMYADWPQWTHHCVGTSPMSYNHQTLDNPRGRTLHHQTDHQLLATESVVFSASLRHCQVNGAWYLPAAAAETAQRRTRWGCFYDSGDVWEPDVDRVHRCGP